MVDNAFRRETVISVDAAVVGISRERWTALQAGEDTLDEARRIMTVNSFDVLPVVSAGRRVLSYFRTRHWNRFDLIDSARLGYADLIPFDTPIREVIRALAERKRPFFFLTYEAEIVGLISVANLNARQVQVYLFGLLSELEKRLGLFLSSRLSAEEFHGELRRANQAGRRYEQDKRAGVEAAPVEYLDFPELVEIANRRGLIQEIDLATERELDLRQLRQLRNKIAHPVRSLVGRSTSVRGLWEWILLVEELIFGLRGITGQA